MSIDLKAQAKQVEATGQVEHAITLYTQYLASTPNDTPVIFHLENLLIGQKRVKDAFGMLVECFLNDRSYDELKGILATHIITKYLHPYVNKSTPKHLFNFDLNEDKFTKHLYRGLSDHIHLFKESIALIRKYKGNTLNIYNSPHYIIALPKSASSLFGICVGNMISMHHGTFEKDKPSGRRGYPTWWEMGVTQDWELRLDIAADPLFQTFPGGIYKGHIEPLGKNLAILDMYRYSKYILWFRDPRDHIAAMFCEALRETHEEAKYSPIFPHDKNRARVDDIEGSINYLIEDGWLFSALMYIAKWIHYRDANKSIISTYEDLVEDPLQCLKKTSRLLELKVDDRIIMEIYANSSQITDRSKNELGKDKYPKGWTGKVGVWQDYFSSQNVGKFEKVVAQFLKAFPWAENIKGLYPDIF